MENKSESRQQTALIILRVLIGWHFLYEGYVKLFSSYWSSAAYLENATAVFRWISEYPGLVALIDLINVWALLLTGFLLIAGLFTRTASLAGVLLLGLYYLSNPPVIGFDPAGAQEGNYLIVNKNLIEMAALYVLFLFPTGEQAGLDYFISRHKKEKKDVK